MTDQQKCKFCSARLSSAKLPEIGTLWRCDACHNGIYTEDGSFYQWKRPELAAERQKYNETRKKSRKPCPECKKMMTEIVMEDFGSRWQCEACRLTVYATGGVQRWRSAKK